MFLFMYSKISALLMFLIWEQNDLEFGENDLFVQCIVSSSLMIKTLPMKANS